MRAKVTLRILFSLINPRNVSLVSNEKILTTKHRKSHKLGKFGETKVLDRGNFQKTATRTYCTVFQNGNEQIFVKGKKSLDIQNFGRNRTVLTISHLSFP